MSDDKHDFRAKLKGSVIAGAVTMAGAFEFLEMLSDGEKPLDAAAKAIKRTEARTRHIKKAGERRMK
jgi:hypothetical protein